LLSRPLGLFVGPDQAALEQLLASFEPAFTASSARP
jgi:hypothetical protein